MASWRVFWVPQDELRGGVRRRVLAGWEDLPAREDEIGIQAGEPIDLKAEFYARVGERGAPSEVETRLRATIAALKKTIANKNAELAQLRADVPALVRTVNQLTLENQELRETLANPSAEVIPIRGRRSRHTED